MSEVPRTSVKLAPVTTSEAEVGALSRIYEKALQRYAQAKAAEHSQPGGYDDKEGRSSSNDFHAAKARIPR